MRQRGIFWAGVLLIAIGIAFAGLPKDWIEEAIGFEPDGGNGLVELLIALVPCLLGVGLLVVAYLQSPRRASEHMMSP